MAQQITLNQTVGSRGSGIVVVRSDATGGVKLNTAAGAEGANSINEFVQSMTITDIAWSCAASAKWDIKRGDTTVYTCHGSGHLNSGDNQLRLETIAEQTANVQFILTGDGTLILKLHKVSGA